MKVGTTRVHLRLCYSPAETCYWEIRYPYWIITLGYRERPYREEIIEQSQISVRNKGTFYVGTCSYCIHNLLIIICINI